MHSVWTRANSVFFGSLFALGIMCAATTFTTLFHQSNPVVHTLQFNQLYSLRNYRDNVDRATLSFDLDADLGSVFNWNVKQLFVYVVAEYESDTNAHNRVVIWDKIVQTKEKATQLRFLDESVKYFLTDQFDELRGRNVSLHLEWDIMPVCGRLLVETMGSTHFVLPDTYQGKLARHF